MSFPFTTLTALIGYFISRATLKSSKQVYIGLFLALVLILTLMIYEEGVSLRATHLSATSFSIVILIVTFFETTLLERHITMIKKGEIGSNSKSVEREYNEIFLLIGSGLFGLILSLISGFMVIGEVDIELIFKIIFTSFAVRGTILSFAMVLLAYFGNSIILINYI